MAVSPDSMIASAPISTEPAASATSARVGRNSVRIDSSTCVATMTGTPRSRARPQHFFLHVRHLFERQLEAEVTARHHHRIGRLDNLGQPCDRFGPLQLRDDRHMRPARLDRDRARAGNVRGGLHEAERDEIDARGQPKPEIGGRPCR